MRDPQMNNGSRITELVHNRPVYPGMLDVADLTVGRIVRCYIANQSYSRFRVVSEPRDGRVRLAIQEARFANSASRESEHSLADLGMVPYSRSGLWNSTNHVTADDA